MTEKTLTTADLARMLRQILDSEEKEAVEIQDPGYAYTDVYRVPWRGTEVYYSLALERGLANCPVCGVMVSMGYFGLSGYGAQAELRFEDLHVLEVHAGSVGGELVMDLDALQKTLGVQDIPLVERRDERLQAILMALWGIQNSVVSQYYTYSRDMVQKRREGYLTTFQGREFRVWFFYGPEDELPCPICGFEHWKDILAISLAEGENRVDIPTSARHLMEVHGLTEYTGWQVWQHPGDYEKLIALLGLSQ
jgi:hypothetical protein